MENTKESKNQNISEEVVSNATTECKTDNEKETYSEKAPAFHLKARELFTDMLSKRMNLETKLVNPPGPETVDDSYNKNEDSEYAFMGCSVPRTKEISYDKEGHLSVCGIDILVNADHQGLLFDFIATDNMLCTMTHNGGSFDFKIDCFNVHIEQSQLEQEVTKAVEFVGRFLNHHMKS